MGGKEAYHSPGELDICCCCFVVVVLLGVTVFCVVIYFCFGDDFKMTSALFTVVRDAENSENSNTRTSSLRRGYCLIIMWLKQAQIEEARASRTRSAFHVFKNTTTTKKKKRDDENDERRERS